MVAGSAFTIPPSLRGPQFVIEADDRNHASSPAAHYLDDFLGISRLEVNPVMYEDRCRAACDALGIQSKHSKYHQHHYPVPRL